MTAPRAIRYMPYATRHKKDDMKVLGNELPPPFPAFWDRFKDEIPVPAESIETGHSVVFGDQGADLTAPALPAWASLPPADLAYHAAHELAHIIQRRRGYPKAVRGRQYAADSPEARVGADIEELVLHPPLEDLLLRELGFTNDLIRARMLQGALNGVAAGPPPEYGTDWFTTWAIRYCELQLCLPPAEWAPLQAAFRQRSPAVSRLGDDLAAIMRATGWGTREQALAAMIGIRDALGLRVHDIMLVLDPVSGDIL